MNNFQVETEQRLVSFAASVLNVAEQLPGELKASGLTAQLVSSATAPAITYAEFAETSKDFLNKLKGCLRNLRDTHVTLRIVKHLPSMDNKVVDPVIEDCSHLIALFAKSVKTKKNNLANGKQKTTEVVV
jgi:four helix bundle protein